MTFSDEQSWLFFWYATGLLSLVAALCVVLSDD